MAESDLPKIGAPATRALASIGITCLEQLANVTDEELLCLHGFGPRALRIVRDALEEHGVNSAPQRVRPSRMTDG
jgi:predicted flap endonuclease-1-like 5' DNA nuclease